VSYTEVGTTDRITQLALYLIEKHGIDSYPTPELNGLKLLEEAGELAGCILRGIDPSGELADVEICLRVLSHKLGVDLNEAVRVKVESDTRSFVAP
jgi:NTP pyrophosphatase (non-canonical NTP hydrolase)